jgi:hypothetical protein
LTTLTAICRVEDITPQTKKSSKERVILNTAETLTAAKNLLVEKGWIQGEAQTDDGFCLLGALGHVTYQDALDTPFNEDYDNAVVAVRDSLFARRSNGIISGFNDNPETTLEDVLTLLDEAIDRVS